VLIAAHGNSLRALVKYLDNMSDADIMALNIPTGMYAICNYVMCHFASFLKDSLILDINKHWNRC